MATNEPTVRPATEDDVPTILQLIHELAAYEHASSSVLATPSSLLSTLSFPSNPSSGYAKTLLIFPPPSPSTTSPPSTTNPPTSPNPPTPSSPPPCAGMALYFHNYSTWRAAPGIYLEDLFIRPEYRGKGYGKRLFRELAREVKRVGGERLEWSVLKWNEPSIAFYEGLGAKRLDGWVGMRVEGWEGLGRIAGEGEGGRGGL